MWSNGKIETDIPTKLLEKVADSDDNVDEHNEHGVKGHKEDLVVSERSYKKKNKKKNKKRKKHSLYPYFSDHNMNHSSYYEPGLEIDIGGGDVGGE